MENAEPKPGKKNYYFQDFGFLGNCLPGTFSYFPDYIINKIELIQEHFMWKHSCPEVQHETLRIDQKIGGLKNVDIFLKIVVFVG